MLSASFSASTSDRRQSQTVIWRDKSGVSTYTLESGGLALKWDNGSDSHLKQAAN